MFPKLRNLQSATDTDIDSNVVELGYYDHGV